MDLGLSGKVAAITGGGSGIGLGVAEGLAREGVHLLLAGRRAEVLATETKRLSRDYGVTAVPVAGDIATVAGVDALTEAARQEFGGADILISNAGAGSNETIMEAPDEKWQAYWELHVMAAVRLARGFVPMMRTRGGGVILHNASICAVQPLYYEPIYNVTKAALMMFSKNLAVEVIKDNIRVNTINPGLILTEGWIEPVKRITANSGGDWQGYLQNVADEHAPIKRFGTVEELADFFVFLCSERASYCVGSAYFVDGGWLRTV
jgi:NAD(P)-dependent dehydrogenase (short-subunit alcohol dehydrogenase family)